MNFQDILKDLRAAGLTQMKIAGAVKCSQVAISDMMSGKTKEPYYTLGVKLVALHKKTIAALKK